MTPSLLRAAVVAERTEWIRRMLSRARALPLDSLASFTSDPLYVPAAESYLRRALEALLDLGRHVLAKGFGQPVSEYKEVVRCLVEVGVLAVPEGELLTKLAGYRNRLVHFYDEIGDSELFEICAYQLSDIERILDAVLVWVQAHPERIDRAL